MFATDQTAKPPDLSEQTPAAGMPLEPGSLGDMHPADSGIGLEDFMIAWRGQHVDRCRRIDRTKQGYQGTGEHRVAQVIELQDENPPRDGHSASFPEKAPDRHRQRPDRVQCVHDDSPPQLAVAVPSRNHRHRTTWRPRHTPPPFFAQCAAKDNARRQIPPDEDQGLLSMIEPGRCGSRSSDLDERTEHARRSIP